MFAIVSFTSRRRGECVWSAWPAARLDREGGGRPRTAQLPLTEKVARADHVLDNSATLAQLTPGGRLAANLGIVPGLLADGRAGHLSDRGLNPVVVKPAAGASPCRTLTR